MDSFVDKIAQKINAQDMIRANAEAEAAEMDRVKSQAEQMQKQLEQYDLCMQEMRKLNLRNTESAQLIQDLTEDARGIQELIRRDSAETEDKISQLTRECVARIHAIQGQDNGKEEILIKLQELQNISFNYKKDTEELQNTFSNYGKDMKELQNILSNYGSHMEELQKAVSEYKTGMEDLVHKENVKVYRNVQAVVVEELEKQTKEILLEQERTAGKSKAILPIAIISMIIGLGNIGLLIVHIFGIL